jgi:N-acetylneuraminate synthase
MASNNEILIAKEASSPERTMFLHCISSYPTKVENSRLNRLATIRGLTNCPTGLSDHTLGTEIPIAATVLGAVLIEKHLKLLYPDSGGGTSEDAEFSSTPTDFIKMVEAVKRIWMAMQNTADTDDESRQFRRSIYAIADIKEGECYTEENIRSIRPAYGLPPARMSSLLGKPSKRAWRKGEPLS